MPDAHGQVLRFPADRIHRATPHPADAIVVTHHGESLTFANPGEYWASVRQADPDLAGRLEDARAGLVRAHELQRIARAEVRRALALQAEAATVLAREAKRRRQWADVRALVELAAVAGAVAGLAFAGFCA